MDVTKDQVIGEISTNVSAHIGHINPFVIVGIITGFYYLNMRYYDPEIRRFINMDNPELVSQLVQTPGQLNMYAYCNNNPISFTDESGNFITIGTAMLIGALIGFLSGGISSIVFQGIEYGWEKINYGQALFEGALGAISGALSMSGVGVGGQIFASAIISTLSHTTDAIIHGKNPDDGLLLSVLTGIFFAGVGGDGLFLRRGGSICKGDSVRSFIRNLNKYDITKLALKSAAVSGATNLGFKLYGKVKNIFTPNRGIACNLYVVGG